MPRCAAPYGAQCECRTYFTRIRLRRIRAVRRSTAPHVRRRTARSVNAPLHSISYLAFVWLCCSFPVSAHVSVLAASLLLLQLFGTPFLWPFVVISPLTVFGANSNLSSITLLSGLLNAPLHPAPQIQGVYRWHCALYKFTCLLTYSTKT